MPSVLVVDDEPLARKRLARLLGKIGDYQLIGEAESGISAVEQAAALQPDLVLMDIRMPGMDGLEASRLISSTEDAPAIIFCTAYDDYALEAFSAAAVGYLLKPVRLESLEVALQRARRPNRSQLAALREQAGGRRMHLSASTHNGLQLLPVEEVRLLIAENKYVSACHADGELLLDDSLKELENEFPDLFLRIHRNALVSPGAVRAIVKLEGGGYGLQLKDIARVPEVSRRHLAEVKRILRDA